MAERLREHADTVNNPTKALCQEAADDIEMLLQRLHSLEVRTDPELFMKAAKARASATSGWKRTRAPTSAWKWFCIILWLGDPQRFGMPASRAYGDVFGVPLRRLARLGQRRSNSNMLKVGIPALTHRSGDVLAGGSGPFPGTRL